MNVGNAHLTEVALPDAAMPDGEPRFGVPR
jgi:hypothetical protein